MSSHATKGSTFESNDHLALPPELDLTISTRRDIGETHHTWSSVEIQSQLPTDIVLITVSDHEFNSCYTYIRLTRQVQQSWCDSVGMVNFGAFGERDVRVALIRSEQGPVSALLVVKNATEILNPKVVLFVGYCATINPAKAKLGDVIISAKLATYSSKRITSDGTQELHGVKADITQRMSKLILYADDGWVPPLKEQLQSEITVQVHRQAVLLSGPEVVQNRTRCEELQRSFSDAIGLEMEGEGLYAAARDLGIEWAVIKGVSDFADGSKTATDEWRLFASTMAASVVHNMFKYPDVIQHWPRYKKSVMKTTVPYGLRDLPRDMVQRPSEVDEILRILKTGNNVGVVGVRSGGVIGIRGMGGIGKTVLAQTIAWSESHARQVIWLDFGQTPDCLALINTLVKALGGAVSYSGLTDAKHWIRNNTVDKDCLVVLDDVWSVDDAHVFDCLSENCQLLITTRDANVVRGLKGSSMYEVQVMPQNKSRTLLYQSAQVTEDEQASFTPDMLIIVNKLLGECRGLPLALSLVGSNLTDKRLEEDWSDMLDDLKSADLASLRSLFPKDSYPYDNLLAAMDVSFQRLETIEQEKFLDFAIFPEDTDVPSDILGLFWSSAGGRKNPSSPKQTRRLLDVLERKSLIQKGATLQGKKSYRVHDLLLDFARGKLGKTVADVQRMFIEVLRGECGNREWPQFRGNKDYYFKYLPYHMHSSEQSGELLELFFDFRWLEQKVKATGVTSLISDFRFLDTSSHEIKLLKSSLILSAEVIEKTPDSIGVQILGRLQSCSDKFRRVNTLVNLARETCAKTCHLLPISSCLTEPVGPLIKTFTMDSRVSAFATFVDSDEASVISALEDSAIKINNLETGRELQVLKGHTAGVFCLALSHSGRMLASGSEDDTARLWNMDSSEGQFVLKHARTVTSLDFSGDDLRLFTASEAGEFSVWSVAKGELLETILADKIGNLCATRDGLHIATTSSDNTIKLRHADTLNIEATLVGHADHVGSVVATNDSRMLVSASYDGTLKIWDLQTHREIRTICDHRGQIYCVAVSDDLKHLICGGDDHIVRLWCFNTGRFLFSFTGHSGSISCVTIICDGSKALSGSLDGSIRVWDLDHNAYLKQDRSCRHVEDVIDIIAIAPDGSTCVSSSEDGTLKVWACRDEKELLTLRGRRRKAIAISPDGLHVLSIGWYDYSVIKIMGLADGKEVAEREFDNQSWLTLARFSPSGELVIIVSNINRAYIWDWRNNGVPTALTLPAFAILEIACDSNMVYLSSENNNVCQVDLGSLQVSVVSQGPYFSMPSVILPDGESILLVNAFTGNALVVSSSPFSSKGKAVEAEHPEGSFITAIDITSDGKLALSGSSLGTISLVNLESHKVMQKFTNARGGTGIRLVCVLRNDTSFLVVDDANRVELRNLDNNVADVVLDQPTVKVNCVASLRLKYFLLGCANGELLLFDYHKGIGDVSKQQAHDEAVSRVKSHPSNEFLSFVSGSANGTVKLWHVTETDNPVWSQMWSHDNIHLSFITALAFVPNSEDIVCGSRDHHGLYRVNAAGIVRAYDSIGGSFALRVVNNTLVAICLVKGGVDLVKFNLDDGHEIVRKTVDYSLAIDQVLRVDLASGRVVSRGMYAFLFLWNLETGSIIRRLRGDHDTRDVQDLAFVPGGAFLLSRCWRDKTLRLWDLRTGCVVEEFHFDHDVLAFACASNGTVCVGLEDGQLCFLRLNNLSSHAEQLSIEEP